ncbi:MAG: DUF2190 family protein [Clostridium sp.]|nr:DUF2190 family protein [Clostridium sp.]
MNNAYEIPNLRFSLPAGADIPRRRFVSVNSSGEGVIATAAGSAIGVSMNQAADGEVLEIADGIVMVEAGGAITAGAGIEVGADGKAVTNTGGIGIGIALTGAASAGSIVAVKMLNTSATNGVDAPLVQTFVYTAADLDAGADLADTPIGYVAADGEIINVAIISTGSAVGIDADNTSAFVLKVGTTSKATATFDDANAFPAAGVAEAGTLAEDATVAAGDVLLLNVTNGANANLPVFMVQVVIALD